MKKRLLMVLGSTLAISAIGVGSTLALFTAEKQTEGEFTAGTLCLKSDRNDGEPVPGPMFYITAQQGATPSGKLGKYPTGVWAPGDDHTRTLTVSNPESCSSMDAWLTKVSATLADGSDPLLAEKLWVEVYTPQGGGLGSLVKVGEGWMSDLLSAPFSIAYPGGGKIPLDLSSNRHMEFKVSFDRNADNTYQDKTLVVHFNVHAEQMKNNP